MKMFSALLAVVIPLTKGQYWKCFGVSLLVARTSHWTNNRPLVVWDAMAFEKRSSCRWFETPGNKDDRSYRKRCHWILSICVHGKIHLVHVNAELHQPGISGQYSLEKSAIEKSSFGPRCLIMDAFMVSRMHFTSSNLERLSRCDDVYRVIYPLCRAADVLVDSTHRAQVMTTFNFLSRA